MTSRRPIKMTDQELWDWTDNATYEELLKKWRFAKDGDPLFRCGMGRHFSDVMFKRKAALPPGEAARISKKVGWK